VNILYPVILGVPDGIQTLSPRERVKFLSGHARAALAMSANFSRASLDELKKDPDGVPLPSNGYFWSLTHKPLFVGAVVSARPVGLDIEQIKPFHPGMYKKVAVETEWTLSTGNRFFLFYRFWTSKEAVIKTHGTGLRDLLKCRVVEILDEKRLIIEYDGKPHYIEHRYFSGHIASIVETDSQVCWHLDRPPM